MPPDMVKAHAHLDALVDKAYGLSPSCTDLGRVAHLLHVECLLTPSVFHVHGTSERSCIAPSLTFPVDKKGYYLRAR